MIIVYGQQQRHKIILSKDYYSIVDTAINKSIVDIPKSGWNIDCKAVFIDYCNRLNAQSTMLGGGK